MMRQHVFVPRMNDLRGRRHGSERVFKFAADSL